MMFAVRRSSLFWKLVLPVPIAVCIVILMTVLFLPNYLANSARQVAVHSAKQTAEQFKTFRQYYTTDVIKKILDDGHLKPSFNHKLMEKGVPLPATIIHDMSELLETKGVLVKLTSPFPFPNRKSRKLDNFQKEAWNFLKDRPNDVFVFNEIQNGKEIIRVGIADTMVSQACVDCHNSRADSPKTDWKLGELRGVLEIYEDIGVQVARGADINRMIIIGSILVGTVLTIISILVVRKISTPIQKLSEIMGKLAKGNTDIEIPARNRRDEVGNIANAVEVFRKGIIDQKHLQMRIRQSEDRYKGFAKASSDWFWETDSDLSFTYVSGRSEEILGVKSEDVIGKKREEVHQGNLDTGLPAWKEHLQKLADHRPFFDYEFRWRRKDGNEKFISLSGVPQYDDNDQFMGYRGIGRDISERKELEGQIRRAQKMEAVGQLTGGIAHDFNNILGIVQGNLELIKDMIPEDSKALLRVKKAEEGVLRGADITNKLLGFSRKSTELITSINPNELILNIQELIAKSLTASIGVEVRLAEGLWTVDIDAGDFEDAILNLSLNARDAMVDGGYLVFETSNRTIEGESNHQKPTGLSGEFVVISVSDTGSGMSEEIKSRSLEPFFTTKEQGKGTGLGLSMVYGFVERSGGQLIINSEIGEGTTVDLYLPRSQEPVPMSEMKSVERETPPRGNETILVVDDEDDLRDIAASHLEELGYKTLVASDGIEALEVMKLNPNIDLLFSDVVMSGQLNGYQLASSTRKDLPFIKILLTSGFAKIEEEVRDTGDSFSAMLRAETLRKPYNKYDLAVALRNKLDE
ncbi:MAG: PAS domain S-box protein [Sneathiella sp.]|nr:PAS domain S-box protein [Sneathiella sp.]